MPCHMQVFDLTKTQEGTKQQELKTKEAEYQAAAQQASIVSHASLRFVQRR